MSETQAKYVGNPFGIMMGVLCIPALRPDRFSADSRLDSFQGKLERPHPRTAAPALHPEHEHDERTGRFQVAEADFTSGVAYPIVPEHETISGKGLNPTGRYEYCPYQNHELTDINSNPLPGYRPPLKQLTSGSSVGDIVNLR